MGVSSEYKIKEVREMAIIANNKKSKNPPKKPEEKSLKEQWLEESGQPLED